MRIRELAELATARCITNRDSSAWAWEDAYAKAIITECFRIATAAEAEGKKASTKIKDNFPDLI